MYDAIFFFNGAEWHIKSYVLQWVYRQALSYIKQHKVDCVLIRKPDGYDICIMVYLIAGHVEVISCITGHRLIIGGNNHVSDLD